MQITKAALMALLITSASGFGFGSAIAIAVGSYAEKSAQEKLETPEEIISALKIKMEREAIENSYLEGIAMAEAKLEEEQAAARKKAFGEEVVACLIGDTPYPITSPECR